MSIALLTIGLAAPGAQAARHIREFPVPASEISPEGISTGPDGNLWFTKNAGNNIGRMTPPGVVTEFPIPTPQSYPVGIASGPDGNVWFIEQLANKIGRVTTSGVFTEFPVPTSKSEPVGIAAGSDGNLWFTEIYGNNIGAIRPSAPRPLAGTRGRTFSAQLFPFRGPGVE
jgi:virginiamycin B lyase